MQRAAPMLRRISCGRAIFGRRTIQHLSSQRTIHRAHRPSEFSKASRLAAVCRGCNRAGRCLVCCSRSIDQSLAGGLQRPGLVFGIVGGAIMLFEFLLWPKKLARRWRLGSARAWMRAHIWLGLLTVPLILLHSGFHWGGPLSTVLAALFIAVIASGIYGLAMQNWLPRLMLAELPGETITLEATHVAHDLCREAEQMVAAVCGVEPDVLATWRQTYSGALESEHRFHTGPMSLAVGAAGPVGNVRGGVLQNQVAQQVPGSEPLRQAFSREIGPFLWKGGRHTQLSEPGRSALFFRNLRDGRGAGSSRRRRYVGELLRSAAAVRSAGPLATLVARLVACAFAAVDNSNGVDVRSRLRGTEISLV